MKVLGLYASEKATPSPRHAEYRPYEEYLLTFDRSLGSAWNWNYGTIYCFKKLN